MDADLRDLSEPRPRSSDLGGDRGELAGRVPRRAVLPLARRRDRRVDDVLPLRRPLRRLVRLRLAPRAGDERALPRGDPGALGQEWGQDARRE